MWAKRHELKVLLNKVSQVNCILNLDATAYNPRTFTHTYTFKGIKECPMLKTRGPISICNSGLSYVSPLHCMFSLGESGNYTKGRQRNGGIITLLSDSV